MTRTILRALNGPILILITAMGIALQSSLFSSWPLQYFQPDMILLTVVWCALRREFDEGGLLTLILAEMGEIHSSSPRGLYLISYMTVYLLIRSSARFLVIPSLFSYAMLTLMGSIICKLSGLAVLYLLNSGANQWRHTVTFLFIGAAIESAFSLWVYRWFEKLDWVTFKNVRAEHALDEELQLDNEGF